MSRGTAKAGLATATMGTMVSSEPSHGDAVMGIGEVLARLRPDFPEVTISKLRFLEAEGLVEPQRSPSGYRKYTAADLDRLRFVLAAQRDRYLPLRVIREQIEAMQRGERVVGLLASALSSGALPPSGAPSAGGPPAAAREPRGDLGDGRLTRAELADRAGLDEAALLDLEQYGLLVPGPGGYYSGDALTVARAAAQLARYGLAGRHLRAYRATADREVGLLAQLVTPLARQPGAGGREQALETVHELSVLCAQLHGALVRQGLRQVVGG